MPKIDRLESKIAEAKAHLAQLKARHQRLEQSARAEAIARERREETRRRMICGAILLQRVREGDFSYETLVDWIQLWDGTKPSDFALFEAETLLAKTRTEQET